MGKKAIDHTGVKYGRLTGLRPVEKPQGAQSGVYWLWRCECGNEIVRRGTNIKKNGGSCGCLKKELSKERMRNMQKEKHGDIESRFFSRFTKMKSGCWQWNAHCDKDGYGILPQNGPAIRAHRLSYEIHKGEIPNGMVIRHKCDNPGCVNPDHLEYGTPKQNVRDCLDRGRDSMVGSRNNKAKLNEIDVKEIRLSKLSVAEIAELYGVSKSTIKRIKSKKLWRHCV